MAWGFGSGWLFRGYYQGFLRLGGPRRDSSRSDSGALYFDPNVIKLLGRWKSDTMLRCLRIQAHAHRANLAQKMLDHGACTFAPGSHTEDHDMPLPQETPTALNDIINHAELCD